MADANVHQDPFRAQSKPVRGGRLTKLKGVVASYAPSIGLALMVTAGTTPALFAQDLNWDATGGNASVDGGSGNWDGTTPNWTDDAGTTNQAWVAGNNAIFGGTAGTVTIVGPQETDYITLQTDGYTLTGDALTFSTTNASGVTVETGTATIANTLTSTNGFNKAGNGTLILSGSNSLAGTLNVSRGSLVATNADALSGVTTFIMQSSNSALNVDLGGATLAVGNVIVNSPGNSLLHNGTVSFTGVAQVGYGTINAVLDGTGELRKTLPYTTTLNGVNTLTGPVNVNEGQLVIGSTGSILNTSGITIAAAGEMHVNGAGGNAISDTGTINNSGNLILSGSDETVGSIYGSGNIDLRGNTLTTGDASNATISGRISGTGDLIKQGSGTLTLSGTNTATGTLTNSAGTTVVSGTWAGDVQNNANFDLTGTSTVNGTFHNNGTGSVTNTGGGAVSLSGLEGFVANGAIGSASGSVTVSTQNLTYRDGHSETGTVNFNVSDTITEERTAGPTWQGTGFTANFATNANGVFTTGGDFTTTGTITHNSSAALTVSANDTLSFSSLVNMAGSVINVQTDASLVGGGNTTNNSGTVNVAGGGSLVELTGNYNSLATGIVNFNDNAAKTFDVQAGVIRNDGTLNFNAGSTTINSGGGAIQNTLTGDINIANSATVDASGDTLTNTGTIDMLGAGSVLTLDALTNDTGGTLNVQGSLNTDLTQFGGTTNNNGTISGAVSVTNGTFNNGDLAGTQPGTVKGLLLINGIGATVNNNVFSSIDGTVTLDTGDALPSGGVLNGNGGSFTDIVVSDGTFNVNASTMADSVRNQGGAIAIDGGGVILSADYLQSAGSTTIAAGGTLQDSDGTLTMTGGLLESAGLVDAAANINGGELQNLTGGAITGLTTVGVNGTLTSQGQLSLGLINAGIADISGRVDGNIRNTGDFEATGNLTHTGAFFNDAGTATVSTGVMATSGDVFNNSTVMGTTLGSAGFNIAAGAELEAQTFLNGTNTSTVVAGTLDTTDVGTSTIFNLGTMTFGATGIAAGRVENLGTLTSEGQLNEGLINSGTATVSNQILGKISNLDGGLLDISSGLKMDNTLSNATGGVIIIDGTLSGLLEFINSGEVRLASGAAAITSGNFTNTGLIDMRNGTAGESLSIGGNYTGGGNIGIDAVLEGDASATDKLIINGATSGSTGILISNLGGAGAETQTGILVVDVAGSSNGTFTLENGDIALPGGKTGISTGVYVYTLENVGGDWYLKTQLQPSSAVYEAIPNALLGMTKASSLTQRLAGRMTMGRRASGDSANSAVPVSVSSRGAAQVGDKPSVWLNFSGMQLDATSNGSTAGLSYDQDIWRAQAGVDIPLFDGPAGSWIGGVSVFTGGSDLDAVSTLGTGGVTTESTGLGLTATWYGTGGFYTDIQLEYSNFTSDVTSGSMGQLATGVDGAGRFASIEIGQAFDWGQFTLTPQAQLSWSEVDFDNFAGPNGFIVSSGDADSMQLQLGMAADHSWTSANGAKGNLYGIASVKREFRGDTSVLFDTQTLISDAPRWTAELGLGGSVEWTGATSKTAFFGQINTEHAISGGDLSSLSGSVGMRVSW